MSKVKHICSICKNNEAKLYRCIADKHYWICSNRRCNFLSLLRAGYLKMREI